MNAPYSHESSARRVLAIPIAWWVAASTAIGLALGYSAFSAVIFGQLTLPLSEEFSWSLAKATGAHSLATAIIVIAAPLVGAASDRFGAWRVIAFSIAALPLALAQIAIVNGSLVHFYVAVGLIAIVGAGTLPVTYTKILVTWFERRRGLALGICLAGVGAGMSVIPMAFQWLAQGLGWRAAVLAIAVAMACLMLPLGWLFLRQQPRSPREIDGGIENGRRASAADAPVAAERLRPLREYCLSRSFVILAAVFAVLGVANLGLVVNFMSILREEGLDPSTAARLFGVFGASFTVTRIVTGWFLDRFPPRIVALAITLCPAFGALVLFAGDGVANASFAMVLFAIGMGGEFDVMAFFVARYFPKALYGRLYAGIYSLYNCGAMLGPVSVAHYHDVNGSFSGALLMLSAAMAAAAFAFLALPSAVDGRRERAVLDEAPRVRA